MNVSVRQNLKIAQLTLDAGTQQRADGLDEHAVEDYRAALEAGQQLPPIRVCSDGTGWWPTDGFQRIEAHVRAGRESIDADVFEGSIEDAKWDSCAANQKHGLRRSTADKASSVRAALLHPRGAGLSDRQIAEHVGCDHKTVGRYRAELESTGEIPSAHTRTGRDGRTTDVSAIGSRKLTGETQSDSIADLPEELSARFVPPSGMLCCIVHPVHQLMACVAPSTIPDHFFVTTFDFHKCELIGTKKPVPAKYVHRSLTEWPDDEFREIDLWLDATIEHRDTEPWTFNHEMWPSHQAYLAEQNHGIKPSAEQWSQAKRQVSGLFPREPVVAPALVADSAFDF